MRALIAMSGGVDSSVAALLAMKQGLECIGGTMHLHDNACAADAASVAQRLGIPFQEFDCMDRFRTEVMDYFVRCYEQGGTPNPCIECNRRLKFGHLLDIARDLGCNYVVTGHYAQIEFDTVSESSCSGFVNDTFNVKTCDFTCVFCSLTLSICEVCGYCDNSFCYCVAEICFSIALELLKNHS